MGQSEAGTAVVNRVNESHRAIVRIAMGVLEICFNKRFPLGRSLSTTLSGYDAGTGSRRAWRSFIFHDWNSR
jgi:hypothetical protein